jgi:hypothetical protein
MLITITIANNFVRIFFFSWKAVSNTDFEGVMMGQYWILSSLIVFSCLLSSRPNEVCFSEILSQGIIGLFPEIAYA